jgi:two-component system, sensor histidine kinase and response regulator
METLRVLVTDDEMGMRLGVARTLRDFVVEVPDVNDRINFAVDQAQSGEEALEKIRQQRPDILLLDHKMPGISGLDVLDQLAGLPQPLDMLTIMITAYASIETAVTATKRGAYDFLAKPFTPDELKTTVRKAAARLVLAKEARKLAEEKRQVRFEFIRVLGHELKAPLGAVAGYLQMIVDRALGGDVAAYSEMLSRSLLRIEGMNKLIADLLDLTQIESGRKNRQIQKVDLCEAARGALDAVRPAAAERNITLAEELPPALSLLADPREIDMIFNNLLTNAVKYNRDGGRVDLRMCAEPGQVTISVADTGIGMTAEECERLFGEFVRIQNEKTRHILGSGLGLSIVRKLARLYDGDVTVESQPDVGSKFTVVLEEGHA